MYGAASSAAVLRPMFPSYPSAMERPETPRIEVALRRESTWVGPVITSLQHIATLPDNWDGRGSRAINFQDVADALEFLQRVMHDDTRAPSIGPLSSGGIELSWRIDGLEVEAIFDQRRDETVLLVTAESNETEEPIASSEKLFADIVNRLVASDSSLG